MAICATDIPSVTADCCYTPLEIPVSKQCMTEIDPGATEKAASFCCFHRQCELNCSLGYSVHLLLRYKATLLHATTLACPALPKALTLVDNY